MYVRLKSWSIRVLSSILSSNEQPATTTAALQSAPVSQPTKVKRDPEPVANPAVSSKTSKRNY